MKLVDIRCELLYETASAFRIRDESGRQPWLPKSQVELTPVGESAYEAAMPEWLTSEKGLI